MSALYGFAFTDAALKYLEKVVSAKVRGQIKRKIEKLAADPFPPGSKKLKGVTEDDDPVHRIRSGKYRVLYQVKDNPSEIIILDIDHRKDVYK
jgi:mRNA interferase RelE/StbE